MKPRKYTLQGKPIPLNRPRVNTRHNRIYDSQRTLKEDSILQLKLQHADGPFIEGPLSLNATFFMPIPKSYSKKKKDETNGTLHTTVPDLSNLIKYLEDVAQGILFSNDSKISNIHAIKVYDSTPRTEFTISQIEAITLEKVNGK